MKFFKKGQNFQNNNNGGNNEKLRKQQGNKF